MNESARFSLEKGKLYICGGITRSLSTSFLYKIDYFLDLGLKNLNIYINTEGGSVPDALAIVDRMMLLKDSGIHINTIGIGEVASAGIFILAEGSNRFGTENTTYMIHPIIHTIGSDYQVHVQQYAKFHDSFYNNLMTELALKCGKNKPKDIQKFMKTVADTVWLDTDLAMELGLIEGKWTISNEASNK